MEQVQKIADDKKTNIIEAMLASTMVIALKTGDATRINLLLDRTIGKVKEVSDVTITTNDDELLRSVPRAQLVALAKGA